jgi:putative transposase
MRSARFGLLVFLLTGVSVWAQQPASSQQATTPTTAPQDPQAVNVLNQVLAVAGGAPALRAIQDYTGFGNIAEHGRERLHPTGPNQVWSMDFVAAQLADGKRFRSLTIVDIYTRECLAIESEQRFKGEDVVLALNRIKIQRGVPKFLYCDNGSEFSSQAMDLRAYQNEVRMAFSRPGKPPDNAFVESFNGTFRAECLNAHRFTSLTEAQQIVETWRAEYNESRPHRALGEKTPNEFAKEIAASRDFLVLQTAENSP